MMWYDFFETEKAQWNEDFEVEEAEVALLDAEEFPQKNKGRKERRQQRHRKNKVATIKRSERGSSLRVKEGYCVSRGSKKNVKKLAHRAERRVGFENDKCMPLEYKKISKSRYSRKEEPQAKTQPMCRFVLQIS